MFQVIAHAIGESHFISSAVFLYLVGIDWLDLGDWAKAAAGGQTLGFGGDVSSSPSHFVVTRQWDMPHRRHVQVAFAFVPKRHGFLCAAEVNVYRFPLGASLPPNAYWGRAKRRVADVNGNVFQCVFDIS